MAYEPDALALGGKNAPRNQQAMFSKYGHFLSVFLFAALGVRAQERSNFFNPGTMGPNALPPLSNEPADIRYSWAVQAGLAGQVVTAPNHGRDFAFTVPLRAEVAFGRRAMLRIDGTPIEGWVTSESTGAAWRAARRSQVTKGDFRVQAKFVVLDRPFPLPALSLRVTVKTTTGKDEGLHRFLNAPAYQFDVLVSERWKFWDSYLFEVWGYFGFLAWQQQSFGQNDAPAWAMTFGIRGPVGFLGLEHRGFSGWQKDDKPLSLGLLAEVLISSHLDLVINATRTFRDPTSWDIRLGLRVHGGTGSWFD